MAAYFVDSNAVGSADGSSWANAYTTIANALARPILAGDTLWVGDDHAETTAAAVTNTFPGTNANPNFIYCVDHTVASPGTGNLKLTGSVTTTGVASNLTFRGSLYMYGLILNAGNSSNQANLLFGNTGSNTQKYDSCTCVLSNTSASSSMSIGINAGYVLLINTTLTFGATGQGVAFSGRVIWRQTPSALGGATFPTTFINTGAASGSLLMEGVDLSALGAGKTIVGVAGQFRQTVIKDCKLGASVTASGTPGALGQDEVYVVRSDSSGTNYIEQVYKYAGTQTTETTIVRTGGASDGTTTISRKIVTTANSKWVLPFETVPIAIWNSSTSAITTLTIYGTTTGGGVPNNDDIWVEVVYPKDAGDPLGGFVTTTKANNLAASTTTNNSSDGSTWGGGGAGNGFKILVPSFTPALVGPLTVYVKVAKATSTYYIDPKVSI